MGGARTRVEYRLSAPTPPLCFLRNWQSGVLEKNVIANQYEWTAFGREVTRRSGPTNIQDPNRTSDRIVAERNRFSARGSFAKMRQNSMRLHVALQSSTPSKCATQEARFDIPSSDLEFFLTFCRA